MGARGHQLAGFAVALSLCGCAFSGWYRHPESTAAGPAASTAAFVWAELDAQTPCPAVRGLLEGDGPLFFLVPGVKGDGPEVAAAIARLEPLRPSAVLLFRWSAWQRRDVLTSRFAAGVSRLLACAPELDGRLFVLAHSAGGVIASWGASRVTVPQADRSAPALWLLTVAAPLAGIASRARPGEELQQPSFMLDLGSRITHYPAAPRWVQVLHLRTHAPADPLMAPRGDGDTLVPNAPGVGVPQARVVDLPNELTHDGSLAYVSGRLADGTWLQWLDEGHVLSPER